MNARRTEIEYIRLKIENLQRMRGYLQYSLERVRAFLPAEIGWQEFSPEQHEALAAFRVRFSEFQEHASKLMRAIAREQEQATEPFGAVLACMEKLHIVDAPNIWQEIRALRNSINHTYEIDEQRLLRFFQELVEAVPVLLLCFERIEKFCAENYWV